MTEALTELDADGGEDSALFGQDIYSATSLLLGENSPSKKELSLAENLPPKCVSFHSISYQVKQRRFFKKLPPKMILHDVSGVMKTGLNAVMGPTGSGKTSLIDILAGHKDKKGLSGIVLINGQKQPENFRCKSAYVVQDDFLMGTLTVRENVAFSAALRLSSRYNKKQRREKVNQVIRELGLTHVADSKVGTEFIRGISGGEKKRTSIGMELIVAPGILFLDEPTTGLDASTATSVMKLLKDLSQQDRVIIVSIHQPRYSIYKLFDTMTILSKGDLVYHGLAGDHALQYFNDLGYECEQHDNPADFFLDIVFNNEVEALKGTEYTIEDGLPSNRLALAYKESFQFTEISEQLASIMDQASRGNKIYNQFATSFPWQLLILSLCTIKKLIRNPMVSVVQVIIMVVLAVLVGVIYLQLDDDYAGFQNRIGAFFFILTNIVFGNLSALELFIRERSIFIHQNAKGYYRVSAYFFSKVFCDLLPMRFLPVIAFSAITYWMLGLRDDLLKFAIYLLTLLLTSCAAAAIAFFISAGISVFALANLCAAMSYVAQMIFGGFLVNLGSVGSWLNWLQYLSIFRFALNALFENELKDKKYCDKIMNASDKYVCPQNLTVYGNVYLESLGYLDYNIWYNELALFINIVVTLMFTYVTLRCIKKYK